jgi:quinol-cytochrome oxidoreductase complex cytochrome b subunit
MHDFVDKRLVKRIYERPKNERMYYILLVVYFNTLSVLQTT